MVAQNFQTDCLSVMPAHPGLVTSVIVSPCTPSTRLSFLSVLIWDALALWMITTFLGQVILGRTQAKRRPAPPAQDFTFDSYVFLIFSDGKHIFCHLFCIFLLQPYAYHHMLKLSKSLSFTNINFWGLLFLASQSVT